LDLKENLCDCCFTTQIIEKAEIQLYFETGREMKQQRNHKKIPATSKTESG